MINKKGKTVKKMNQIQYVEYKNYSKHKKHRRIILAVLIICICATSAGVSYFTLEKEEEKKEPEAGTTLSTEIIPAIEHLAQKQSEILWEKALYENNKEKLILVNRSIMLKEDYTSDLMGICDGRLQADKVLYEDLVDMLADACDAGYEYWIASAYRSREKQQSLIDEDVAMRMEGGMSYESALAAAYNYKMAPGHSEHETGLALDLLCSGNVKMDTSQAQCEGNKWLCKHCAEYGFILRYPKGKEEITGMNYEPWHFRYVGKEVAEYLTENNLTLEEFYERIE